jgi:hypothetical protein
MGPAKSVAYETTDQKQEEDEKLITLQFKSMSVKEKDFIKSSLKKMTEQKDKEHMTSDANESL